MTPPWSTSSKVLRDRPRELARACVLTPYARDEYTGAVLDEPGIDELERARRFWARSVMSYNRCLNPRASWSSSAKRGSNDAVSAANICDRLLAVAERLRRVAIDNAPAVKVVAKYGVTGAVIYADPPYLGLDPAQPGPAPGLRLSLRALQRGRPSRAGRGPAGHRGRGAAVGLCQRPLRRGAVPGLVAGGAHRPPALGQPGRPGRQQSHRRHLVQPPSADPLELWWARSGPAPEDCEPEAVG